MLTICRTLCIATIIVLSQCDRVFAVSACTGQPAPDKKAAQQFVDAAREGDLDLVKKLLGQGVDVNVISDGYTALHAAVAFNKLAVVKELIKAKAKVNTKHPQHGTPLNSAAWLGYVDIAKELIKAGADLNADSVAPLTSAAQQGKTEMIKVLLDAGAKINVKSYPALHWAEGPAVAKMLIDAGADVNLLNQGGESALHGWARGGRVDLAKVLIAAGANINARDKDGNTPLSVAQKWKQPQFAKLLMDAGADDGMTALGKAAAKGDSATVQKLIGQGAKVNETGPQRKTPLHFASENGHADTVRVLLDAKADVKAKDERNFTPLHLATTKEVAKALIGAGADIQVEGGLLLHASPIFVAATEGRAEVVEALLDSGVKKLPKGLVMFTTVAGRVDVLKLLLKRGGDANDNREFAPTALHVAASGIIGDTAIPKYVTPEVRLQLAKLLIEAGANVNAEVDQGYFEDWTPLHGAASCGHVEMVQLLLQRKANVNAKGGGTIFGGVTPLHEAAHWGHVKVAELLIKAGANINARTEKTAKAGGETPLDMAGSPALRTLLKKHGGKTSAELSSK